MSKANCRGTSILNQDLTCRQITLSFAYWCNPCLHEELIANRKELNRLEQYICPSCGERKMACDEKDECGGAQ